MGVPACALKPVPASMMSAHSSWQHATLLMNSPSSFPFSTCCESVQQQTQSDDRWA